MSVVGSVSYMFWAELKEIILRELLPYAFLMEHLKAYNKPTY